MGNYSVPENIRNMRPSGTTVKKLHGRYYVYEYSSTSKKVVLESGEIKWRSKIIMGPCIGQITEKDGFISSAISVTYCDATVLEFGGYYFLEHYAKETLSLLKHTFNAKDANQIFAVASIFVVNGFTYMTDIKNIYEESILRLQFPDVKMGYNAIHSLYERLGRKGELVDKFEQALIDESSKKIAIDGHVIACAATKNDLSAFGYKYQNIGTAQINWMVAYDIEKKKPLVNQMFNGAEPDKVSVQTLFSRFLFANTLFLVDRGFNTEKDKSLMKENGNSYIMPLISNRVDYAKVCKKIRFDKRRNFYYTSKDSSSMILYQNVLLENGNRYIAYLDTARQYHERTAFINKMNDNVKGYTIEELKKNEANFGLFVFETSDLVKSPKDVFFDYKLRWQIETFYDYIDNSIDFNALYQQDYCLVQGLSFIMQIAGMIYHELKQVTDPKGKSFKSVMNTLKGIKAVKERKRFVIRNNNKERCQLCKSLGLDLPNHYGT